ncbi:retention module-containing protein, partial [Shewanella baltica]|uniref:retention module-containing protein n=1 Tax=Shewanella baltica TaxID=62322 RepID=UPI00217DF2B0
MGSVITSKKGLLKLVKGQINVEVDGSNQPAKDGEQLPKGAVLHIDENATYEITFDDGTKLSNEVAPNDTAAAAPNATDAAALDEIQALQDLIASGEDPTQNLPETAAGNTPGRDGNSGYVTLARSGSEVLATSGYSTTGQALTATSANTPAQTLAIDSPSVVVNDSNTIDEDTVATGNVLDNDSDVDSILSVVSFEVDGTTYAAGTEVTLEGGTLVLNADGSYTFTPNENWNGNVPAITYTTNTGSTATLTIEVTPVDDASVLANDSNTVPEDTVAAGNVLDNDSDIDNTLSVVSYSVNGQTIAAGTAVTLEGGSLLINADGSYTFTPNANWNGQVPVITYTTNTGSTATLTIEVTPVDDASVLANDSNTVPEDTVAAGNVLDNDSDIDNTLSVVSYSVNGQTIAAGNAVTLEGGSLLINADGSYTFTPNANWNGQVPVITYTTNTGSTATLTIEVTPVDDASVLANDSNTVPEDTVAAGNVLDNDSDIDNTLSVVSYSVNGQTIAAGKAVTLEGGSLLINADGFYTFTPNENWNGQVPVITYTTNTGSTATLTIEVTPVNDPVDAVDDEYTVNEDGSVNINLLANDSAPDGGLAIVSING